VSSYNLALPDSWKTKASYAGRPPNNAGSSNASATRSASAWSAGTNARRRNPTSAPRAPPPAQDEARRGPAPLRPSPTSSPCTSCRCTCTSPRPSGAFRVGYARRSSQVTRTTARVYLQNLGDHIVVGEDEIIIEARPGAALAMMSASGPTPPETTTGGSCIRRSLPGKKRTIDLGFRKTSGSEPGFDTGQRNRSGFSLLVQRDHLFSSPVAPPLPNSTMAARKSFAVMSA